ncbi:transposase [Sulfurospirillum sp. hDNRA2]|uniref:transposase n=1 Tax=Sulfurospirillum sp. hDNRA2 TaxID=3237298 RepID=UPI0020B65684|nr:transposase [Sulfurospirillum sp. DNRA8]MCP3652209.1 transposase [Sulfurospirillum sp. DNRA8]MCR1811059.1 transposase [Sulfurospirillum sp. DNRA8]
MPRRLRIENLGYHHVYNRGVAKSDVFEDENDKVKFIELMASIAREFKLNIHSFCLMDNHYHLLIENKRENLSSAMRQLNSQYASYFNKRHNRVGHLWQDRFKSWYVLDENYLLTLFKYIENNPVKAGISSKIGLYPYCATYAILKDAIPAFLQNSFVLRDYPTGELFNLLAIPLSDNERSSIERFHRTRYKKEDDAIVALHVKELAMHFAYATHKTERNDAIKKAYADGYSKSEIARYLILSVAGVSKILKS